MDDVPFWTSTLIAIGLTILGGVIVGLVVLVLEYRTGIFNIRNKKELTFELLSQSLLVSKTRDNIKGKLQIQFNGERVESVTAVALRIANTGNTPITTADFEQPIIIGFEFSVILDSSIDGKAPQMTDVITEYTNTIWELEPDNPRYNSILIKPLLLNEKEWFTLSVIVADYDHECPVIEGRVIGTKFRIINRNSEDVTHPKRDLILFLGGFIAVVISSVFLRILPVDERFVFFFLFPAIPLLTLVAYLLLGFYRKTGG